MHKTIIALRGKPNCGKTSAIKLACKDLQREGKIIDLGDRFTREIRVVLEIDGVRVGFASSGDTPRISERGLNCLIVEMQCAIVVCAAREQRGAEQKIVTVIERLAAENAFEVVWIEKAREEESDRDRADREKANEIIAQVRQAIANAQLVPIA